MSRAFVKEPDGDQVADETPELPQSPHSNYVTPQGLRLLERRRDALEAERCRLRAEPEALAGKLPLAQVERELRWVEGRLERAIPVDLARQPRDEVTFGAVVVAEDENGAAHRFAIVGEDEADPAGGKVSWISPLARAAQGSRVGDLFVWRRPAGDLELEVLSIDYPES